MRCKEIVWDRVSREDYQCIRNAWKDGFCKQHHPEAVAARRQKAFEALEKKRLHSTCEWKLEQAMKRISDLEKELATINGE